MAKAVKPQKAAKRRYVPRQTRKFQLRLEHPVDHHVSEILDFSRSQRREVTVIRDGVRLLWALENNDLSVLFELFPHLKEQFVPAGLNLIEQFQAMLLQSRPPAEQSGPKPLVAPALSMPTFDDDDDLDTIIIKPAQSSSSTANFMKMRMDYHHNGDSPV